MNFTQWDFIKRYSRSKIIRRRRGDIGRKTSNRGIRNGGIVSSFSIGWEKRSPYQKR